MPNGTPIKHQGTAGHVSINFFHDGPVSQPTIAPTSNKKPGTWPLRWEATITGSPSQLPELNLYGMGKSRLRYSFPDLSQIWEFMDDNQNVMETELWVNETLYSYGPSSTDKCYVTPVNLEVLRPDWLHSTNYDSTHYLLKSE
eukprot:UN24981